MFASAKNDAPTSDEPPHILSGYAALKFGKDYIDPEHPLLVKSLAAAPLVFQDIKFEQGDPNFVTQKRTLDVGKMYDASRRFLNYSGNNPDAILFSARLPLIALTTLFGLLVFLFAKRLFGLAAALTATFLYATEPNILAHGRFVNTDTAAAGFILTSIFALFLYRESQSIKNLIFLILSLSVALLSKYSALYLLPLTLVLMTWIYLTQSSRPWRHLIFVVVGVSAAISLFYGLISFRDQGPIGFFPYEFFKGAFLVQHQLTSDQRFSYLLGEGYYGSRWYYFPVLVLAKTQLLTLALFTFSLTLTTLKKFPLKGKGLVLISLPYVVFLALALSAKLNIGVRHVLPFYLFMILFASAAFAFLINYLLKGGRAGLVLAAALTLVIFGGRVWSVATTFPGFLSYYNVAFGGSQNGWKISDDSNYDWGQDVKRLASYVQKNNIKSIAFDNYTGMYAANYYKIPVTAISPADTSYKGYLALSTSVITYHQGRKDNYSWVVDKYEGAAKAGYSIFIYKIP